jgi:hypothetical protein
MTDKAKNYFTPKELSEHLDGRIKVRTLNNWRQNGSGPPFTKIGGAVLYPVTAVEAWLKSRTVSNTSQYSK